MNSKKGLLVIGTQRSGSNLFRLMLNQLPDVVALHPPHILQTFMPLLPRYGDLSQPRVFKVLIDDVCSFVEQNPASWEDISLDREEIFSRCQAQSLIEVYRVVQERAAEVHGKPIWCCKSMANVAYIPEIEQAGLRPTYIHLYRDGRDVALSFKKAIVGEKHMYHLAKQWNLDQEQALTFTKKFAPDRVVSVQYEELLDNPEKVMRGICDRIGARFTPEVLQFHKSDEAQAIAQAGSMWANVVKPIMTKNSNKFLSEMSLEDLQLFEAVAGEMLQALGYELHAKPQMSDRFTDAQIAEFDRENKHLKDEFRAKLPPEELVKRRGQEDLMAQIKARLSSASSLAGSASV